jgi:glutathione S-transferase
MILPTTATIIPFPRPAREQAEPPAPADQEAAADPQERLRRALIALNAALATQREAVAGWRGALGDLRGSVQDLNTSLQSYNSKLGALGERVGTVNTEAKRLEAWADRVLQPPV